MKSFIARESKKFVRDLTTRRNLIIMFCGMVALAIAINVVPLIDDDRVKVQQIPNGWLVDGVCYQVIIDLDEPLDEDLLERYIRVALSNYIKE